MASSSHNTFDGSNDDNFDQYFDQQFDQYFDQIVDQTFDNLSIHNGVQEEKRKKNKKTSLYRAKS